MAWFFTSAAIGGRVVAVNDVQALDLLRENGSALVTRALRPIEGKACLA
jgi:hypothetical protein